MFKKIQERIFPFIIALSALSVSASAAFYSVSGLSKLFAGAAFAVIIMAGSLEIAKLVIASLLYQYRQTLPKLLKIYLSIACVILIGVTSMGIYGFLSSAYQETANKSSIVDNQIKLLETKKLSFEKIKGQYDIEKQSLTENITSLRNALGNNTQSYVDNNGNVISYSSSANRKSFEKQLEVAIQKDEQLTNKIQVFNDSIIGLETKIVEVQNNSTVSSELGPLKYLSSLTGWAMDKIVNILLLTIIFVFDPLAIALVIAANFAFARLKPKKEEFEFIHEEEIDNPEYDEFEEWDSTIDDGLEDEGFDVWGYEDNKIDELNNKIEDLSNKHESLVEYLSQIIEIENQQPKTEDMKLFNLFKKKQEDQIEETQEVNEIISEPIQELPNEAPAEYPTLVETPQVEQPAKIKLDVNNDGNVTMEDLTKVRQILSDPNLPEHKRSYWQLIEKKLSKKFENPDLDNTIHYN